MKEEENKIIVYQTAYTIFKERVPLLFIFKITDNL